MDDGGMNMLQRVHGLINQIQHMLQNELGKGIYKMRKHVKQRPHGKLHIPGHARIRLWTGFGHWQRLYRGVGDQEQNIDVFASALRQRVELIILGDCGVSFVCPGHVIGDLGVWKPVLLRGVALCTHGVADAWQEWIFGSSGTHPHPPTQTHTNYHACYLWIQICGYTHRRTQRGKLRRSVRACVCVCVCVCVWWWR